MINLNEYSNLSLISESFRSLIYMAILDKYNIEVILKVIASEDPSPKDVSRLKNEFNILRGLPIDGVPKVYDFKKEGNRYFFSMDQVPGYALAEVLQANSISYEEFLQLASKTLEILSEIHDFGVVHRDLKPKNIIYDPDTQNIRIIDFGLSRKLSAQTTSVKGTLEGTLEYMPPEQTGRLTKSVDFRSDIYALGMTFYHLLSGHPPFDTKDPLGLVHCQIAKIPPPLNELKYDLPITLSRIIDKMIQKAPEDRYQSVKGVLSDINTCLRDLQSTGNISEFELALNDTSELLNEDKNKSNNIKHENAQTKPNSLDPFAVSLDSKLSKKPNILSFVYHIISIYFRLKKIELHQVNDLNREGSQENIQAQEALLKQLIPLYFTNKARFFSTTLKAITLSLKKGVTHASGTFFTFFSVYLGNKWKRFDDGETVFLIALQLHEKLKNENSYGMSLFAYGAFFKPWLSTLQKSIDALEKSLVMFRNTGNIFMANMSSFYLSAYTLYSGKSLADSSRQLKNHIDLNSNCNKNISNDCLLSAYTFVQCLRGETPFLGRFETNIETEGEFSDRVENSEFKYADAYYGLHKLWAMYLLGDYKNAFELRPRAKKILSTANSSYGSILYHFYQSMTLISLFEGKGLFEKLKYSREIRKSLNILKKHAQLNPNMNAALYEILKTEYKRVCLRIPIRMSIYDEMIRTSQKHELVHIEALVNELAARYFYSKNFRSAASTYARRAKICYEIWGANYKVKLLSFEFPETNIINSPTGSLSISHTATEESNFSSTLDVQTILQSSNALISEIQMDKLLNKLISLLVENAGAERGLLLIPEDENLYVVASRSISEQEEENMTKTVLEQYDEIPISVIHYVQKTKNDLIIEDAFVDPSYSEDIYIHENGIRSLMCYPLLSSGVVKAVIYLENRKAPGVFTADRIELLKILSGQAVFSIDNAKLYEDMEIQLRMETELETAKTVQQTLFPESYASKDGVEIHGYYEPATECGGDWWHHNEINNKLYFWIGDATGHGAAAALITSAACSAVSLIETMDDMTPSRALYLLNRAVYNTSKGQVNMTFLVMCLDKETGQLTYSSASHEVPYLISSDLRNTYISESQSKVKGSWRGLLTPLMKSNGLPLGRVPEMEYEESSIQLSPGDTVILYTDGVMDQLNMKKKFWGERPFLKTFVDASLENNDPTFIKDQILSKSKDFRQDLDLVDDVTFMVFRYKNVASHIIKKAS